MGENFDVLVRWDLMFKQVLITKPKKSSSAQSELLKRYLSEKNLMHGRVVTTTSNLAHRFMKRTFNYEVNVLSSATLHNLHRMHVGRMCVCASGWGEGKGNEKEWLLNAKLLPQTYTELIISSFS